MMGFLQVLTFFALLTTGYVYVWRKGAFDWSGKRSAEAAEPRRRKGWRELKNHV